jgi:hypothetical protein
MRRVQHCQIKLFRLHFHIASAIIFIYLFFVLKILGHGNPDNNLESLCIFLFFNRDVGTGYYGLLQVEE